MNLNTLARTITLKEGGKKSISIAQVKEVMKLLLIELANMSVAECDKVIDRYKKKYENKKRSWN